MTTKALRNRIIESVQNISDDRLLRDVLQYIELESDDRFVFVLSDNQLEAINKARLQVENGETTTHEEVMKETEEWLKE